MKTVADTAYLAPWHTYRPSRMARQKVQTSTHCQSLRRAAGRAIIARKRIEKQNGTSKRGSERSELRSAEYGGHKRRGLPVNAGQRNKHLCHRVHCVSKVSNSCYTKPAPQPTEKRATSAGFSGFTQYGSFILYLSKEYRHEHMQLS